ncbi:hypothetical protein ACFORG_15270 [Lutimaribacter marinistellae]|uniref:Uncharacterized protein n=1 Tax=Lutimaribacter marinistellae TaxID=1820329 RepID=A0ABV7TJR0_9RHOB
MSEHDVCEQKASLSLALKPIEKIGLLIWISKAILFCLVVGATKASQADPLTERGIDPKTIELMVSELSTDLRYTRFAEIEVRTAEETLTDRVLIDFDPKTPAGIDLTLKFDKQTPTTASTRRFRRVLESRMRLQHEIRSLNVTYDPDSILLLSSSGPIDIYQFRYSPFGLAQDIAWIRFLQGRIWVNDDRVTRILLTLDEGRTFFHDGTLVSDYRLDVSFARASNGTDVIQNSVNVIVARDLFLGVVPNNQKFVTTVRSTAVSYEDEDGKDVTPRSSAALQGVDLSKFNNPVRVNIDRKFPIFGKQARAAGYEFPKPFGVSLMYTDLTTMLNFTSFEINGVREPIEAIFSPNGSGIDIRAKTPQLRVDWFPFPFLNVMGLIGELEAKGNLKIRTTGLGQLVGLPPVIEEQITINSSVLGGGLTLAGGWRNYFASLTGTAMTTVTEDAGTRSTAYTVTPQVGYYFPRYRLRVMVGADYVKLDNKMVGSIPLPDGTNLDFNIGLEHEEWASRFGIYKQIGNNMELTLTGTYGDTRKGATVMLGYRF